MLLCAAALTKRRSTPVFLSWSVYSSCALFPSP